MEKPKLEHGELTEIIIGTVVACEDHRGITAKQLAAKLNAEGIAITKPQAGTRLAELYANGRIERVARGRYKGV
jgi:hypothetical protein